MTRYFKNNWDPELYFPPRNRHFLLFLFCMQPRCDHDTPLAVLSYDTSPGLEKHSTELYLLIYLFIWRTFFCQKIEHGKERYKLLN